MEFNYPPLGYDPYEQPTEIEQQVIDEFLSQGWGYAMLFSRRQLLHREIDMVTVVMPGCEIVQYKLV